MGEKEFIKQNLCPNCKNACKNCIKLQFNDNRNIHIYKCINYQKKDKNQNITYIFKYKVKSNEDEEEIICKIM